MYHDDDVSPRRQSAQQAAIDRRVNNEQNRGVWESVPDAILAAELLLERAQEVYAGRVFPLTFDKKSIYVKIEGHFGRPQPVNGVQVAGEFEDLCKSLGIERKSSGRNHRWYITRDNASRVVAGLSPKAAVPVTSEAPVSIASERVVKITLSHAQLGTRYNIDVGSTTVDITVE